MHRTTNIINRKYIPCIEKSANYDTFLNMFMICFSNTFTSIGLETRPFIPASIAIFLSSSNALAVIENKFESTSTDYSVIYIIDILPLEPYNKHKDRIPVIENIVRSPLAAYK